MPLGRIQQHILLDGGKKSLLQFFNYFILFTIYTTWKHLYVDSRRPIFNHIYPHFQFTSTFLTKLELTHPSYACFVGKSLGEVGKWTFSLLPQGKAGCCFSLSLDRANLCVTQRNRLQIHACNSSRAAARWVQGLQKLCEQLPAWA